MRIAYVITLICLASFGTAQAGGQFGFFLDEDATVKSTNAAVGEIVTVYLVINNLDFSGDVTAWSLVGVGVANIAPDSSFPDFLGFPFAWTLRGGGVDNSSGPCYSSIMSEQNLWCPDVTYAVPYAVTGAAVLAELQVEVPNLDDLGIYHDSWSMDLQLSGGATEGLEPGTSQLSTMPPMMGWLSATINSDNVPVGTTETSWSGVKALYR